MERRGSSSSAGNLRLVLSVIQRFPGRGENAGRPVPGGVHRPDQGHRQLRHRPGRALFHLRRAHDRRGRSAAICGTTAPSGCQPLACGTRPTRCCRRKEKLMAEHPAGAHRGARSPSIWTSRGRTWSWPWTPSWTRCRLYEPVYADGGDDAICVMDQVRDTEEHRRELAGAHRTEGGHVRGSTERERQHPRPAVLARARPRWRSAGEVRHLSGPGIASGEGGHQRYPAEYVNGRKRRGRGDPAAPLCRYSSGSAATSGASGSAGSSHGTMVATQRLIFLPSLKNFRS